MSVADLKGGEQLLGGITDGCYKGAITDDRGTLTTCRTGSVILESWTLTDICSGFKERDIGSQGYAITIHRLLQDMISSTVDLRSRQLYTASMCSLIFLRLSKRDSPRKKREAP